MLETRFQGFKKDIYI